MAEINGKQVILCNIRNNCTDKPILNIEFESCKTERRIYKRTLIYHPSNSKKGFPIKGTNLRVSF